MTYELSSCTAYVASVSDPVIRVLLSNDDDEDKEYFSQKVNQSLMLFSLLNNGEFGRFAVVAVVVEAP